MKILVPIKRVVDYRTKVQPKMDGTGVDTDNVNMSINPFCAVAMEEAVRIKETGLAKEVIAVSIGPETAEVQLRAALAAGADRALLIVTDQNLEPLAVAKCLQIIVNREQPDIVLMGKQSIDGDNNQTGQMLAALCHMPQATFASHINIDRNTVYVRREIDRGYETLALNLPVVITVDLRLNEPRYIAQPKMEAVQKKPIEVLALEQLNVDTAPRTELLSVSEPPQRSRGIKVSSVAELVDKLKSEAKVI